MKSDGDGVMKKRVLILGAAGRDFHNFNVVFRENASVDVLAFTAAQIPGIADRRYPALLAGARYPNGIPIEDENRLESIVKERDIDEVVFGYSDVSHEHVMHLASRALSSGADFTLLGPARTMLRSRLPVVAITAVRTGCGKSAVSRRVVSVLRSRGRRVVVLRHPMPYGDLRAERVQRFASLRDLDRAEVTIEEREEYEPHLEAGTVVFAGIDYAEILKQAETEAEVIVWDGGNNDLPFVRPSLHICLVDPHRLGHESRYHPGEANLRMADVVIVAKVDTAAPDAIESLRASIRALNPRSRVTTARLPARIENGRSIAGLNVLAVEDGPTLTHGGLPTGAAELVARRAGARLVDPRPHARGAIQRVFEDYPHLGPILPAIGYSPNQRADLEATINASPCDLVLLGTPIDLARILTLRHDTARVRYDVEEAEGPTFEELLREI
jgi:predicted GTPase